MTLKLRAPYCCHLVLMPLCTKQQSVMH